MTTTTRPIGPEIASRLAERLSRNASPRLGGLNTTLLGLEARRVLRNRRTMVFTLVMPVAFFFMFGTPGYARERYGNGTVGAFIMVGMALYGALMATTGAGAAVSTERASGWSRQLRLTPLSPVAYILAKAGAGMLVSLVSLAAVYLAGLFTHVQMPVGVWLATAVTVWLASFTFVVFGLFMGYLLPTENAMQVVGPMMALLAFLGGLFMPLTPGSTMDRIGSFTPMYGLHELALAPLGAGDFSWWWVLSAVVWLAVFTGGAAWRMSRDTQRV